LPLGVLSRFSLPQSECLGALPIELGTSSSYAFFNCFEDLVHLVVVVVVDRRIPTLREDLELLEHGLRALFRNTEEPLALLGATVSLLRRRDFAFAGPGGGSVRLVFGFFHCGASHPEGMSCIYE